jgi:DNA-binding response OmpR family regulator
VTQSETTILIVDDEEHVRSLLQRILKGAGYNVITVSRGQEAVDIISTEKINLVLLDIIMPGMDGYHTLEKIRAKTDIPVIMVTGVGSTTSVNSSLNLGADDYIKKPFRSSELLARIEAKLRRRKL